MPRYQATKRILINGSQYENQIVKSRVLEVGDKIDYDPTLKSFFVDGIMAQGDLANLITKGYLVSIGASPIFEGGSGGGPGGPIHASDILFTPTGGIQATNVQDALIEAYAESLQAQFIQETLIVQVNGQTQFMLSQDPYTNQSVSLFVNTATYINGVDYTVNGDLITWLNRSFALTTNDEVIAAYFVDIG